MMIMIDVNDDDDVNNDDNDDDDDDDDDDVNNDDDDDDKDDDCLSDCSPVVISQWNKISVRLCETDDNMQEHKFAVVNILSL